MKHIVLSRRASYERPYCYKRKLCGEKQVPSYSLLQFVVAVTASDGDCYMSNFRPRQCGLFIVKVSSTLSLKTVHRTVFLTVAFKSRHRLLVQIKRGLILKHQSSFNGASDGTWTRTSWNTRPSNVPVCLFQHTRIFLSLFSWAVLIIR